MVERILYRKYSTLLGGQDTVEHHEGSSRTAPLGEASLAAKLSANRWHRLRELINDLFEAQAFVS